VLGVDPPFALGRGLSGGLDGGHLLVQHDLLQVAIVVGRIQILDPQYRLLLIVTAYRPDIHWHFLNGTDLDLLRHSCLSRVCH